MIVHQYRYLKVGYDVTTNASLAYRLFSTTPDNVTHRLDLHITPRAEAQLKVVAPHDELLAHCDISMEETRTNGRETVITMYVHRKDNNHVTSLKQVHIMTLPPDNDQISIAVIHYDSFGCIVCTDHGVLRPCNPAEGVNYEVVASPVLNSSKKHLQVDEVQEE